MRHNCHGMANDMKKSSMNWNGLMLNVMSALLNIGGAVCSTLQDLDDAHYQSAIQ